ncbi:hypothetical protein [Thalassomonas actiniarum]|uniref:Uncharacterized protein n=1 Tax=Thalassomonas actiniarum TaxID=485447 RepID=A0AAF0C5R0_9GAMM|nr:hypothetical protein [Thalassomonas actiniarum]WDE01381.1 hypothetical protein SG35_012560 [Thalassomonas actiniarum]
MNLLKTTLVSAIFLIPSSQIMAGVDSDFKEKPHERFTVYTGDGNYKQAYHWVFNENGQGPAVTIFLNHGSGGEWYDEIDTEFGVCGPDYINGNGDFTGTLYDGLCEVDGNGDEVMLADFTVSNVPVGPLLEDFMLKKIVGSTAFAAWYWQDAFAQFDSPVHIFMVGRYNIVKDAAHLDNALYWLNLTDENSVTRDTNPPYNFDGYGVSDIDGDLRPMHAAPDIAGFDNVFLYKAVKEQYPNISLNNIIIEGRSNGGSAMIALAADHHIWPQNTREFWGRNLPAPNEQPQPDPDPVIIPALTLNDIVNNPQYADAFNAMLANISAADLDARLNNGESLNLYSNHMVVNGTAGEQANVEEPEVNPNGNFSVETYHADLAAFIGGNFYDDVKMIHSFYPGCQLDGTMEKDDSLQQGVVADDGDNANGYKVAIKTMFSFGDEDSLYKAECDDRVNEGAVQTDVAGTFAASTITDGSVSVIGELFSPAQHGFDYKDVETNQPGDTQNEQDRAAESRRAIERVINQAIAELGLNGSYALPDNLN